MHHTVTLKLGFGVIPGHRKWHHPFDRAHTTLYSSSVVTSLCPYLLLFPSYSDILVKTWASDITEWRSFNWHQIQRQSQLTDAEVVSVISTLHLGLTMTVNAVSETMSSSSNWLNVGNMRTRTNTILVQYLYQKAYSDDAAAK